MEDVSIIGIDLAKRSFQVHGARADGSVAYRRKLSRGKLLGFLASQPPCTVAMEACASAHYWGREIAALGHEVRLVPPVYMKPFVKRHKNDAADAEAITEAAQRPTMHFVAVKSEAQQAQAMLFHTRDLLVRQRTQTINALRGHLAEYGVVAPQGRARIGQLAGVLEDGDSGLPEAVVELGWLACLLNVTETSPWMYSVTLLPGTPEDTGFRAIVGSEHWLLVGQADDGEGRDPPSATVVLFAARAALTDRGHCPSSQSRREPPVPFRFSLLQGLGHRPRQTQPKKLAVLSSGGYRFRGNEHPTRRS